MKLCNTCQTEKSLEKFSINKTRKDGQHSKCKECHSLYRKQHYNKNKKKILSQIKNRQIEISSWLKEYKLSKGCQICGYNKYSNVLQIHHLNPKTKTINPAQWGSNGWSLNRIKKELIECIVLCANCHVEIHNET